MVVSGFRRSISFPNNPNRPSKPPKTYHVRSTSLPCRSHPLITHLEDDINGLKSWANSKSHNRTSAWLCDGLSRLRTVHESLDDILSLPQTYESVCQQFTFEFVEKLLEDFLRYVDVYGIFQTIILSLKQDSSAAQMAIRRKSDSKIIALYAKSLKKTSKDMSKLISTVQSIGRCSISASNGDSTELAELLRDVNEVTVLVSTALFNGISSSLGRRCRSSCTSKSSWMMMMGLKFSKDAKREKIEEDEYYCCIEEFQQVGIDQISLQGGQGVITLRNKGDEEVKMVLKRMQNLEDSISEIESCSERVFRSLINTRVSLLNFLTR